LTRIAESTDTKVVCSAWISVFTRGPVLEGEKTTAFEGWRWTACEKDAERIVFKFFKDEERRAAF